jgi:LEA14-like dessication related protein
MRLRTFVAVAVAVGLAGVACASMKPPTLQVQKLGVDRAGVTGVSLKVGFAVQNPNDKDLQIERFEYELLLNGQSLGHGYSADPLTLRAFGDERVESRFNVNLLRLPGAVKALLDQSRVKARAKGTFHVREGDGIKKVGFDSEASVDLDR